MKSLSTMLIADILSELYGADSAVRRAPEAAEPYFLTGLIYARTLRWDEAERAYRNAIDRDPVALL